MKDKLAMQIAAALIRDGVCPITKDEVVAALKPVALDKCAFGGVALPVTSPGRVAGPTVFATASVGVYRGFSGHFVGAGKIALFYSEDGAEWQRWIVYDSTCCGDVDYPKEVGRSTPLTFRALEASTVKLVGYNYDGAPYSPLSVEVSTDGGQTWEERTASVEGTVLADLQPGEEVQVRGNNAAYSSGPDITYFDATAPCLVYGNVMSLVDAEGFETEDTVAEAAFAGLFVAKRSDGDIIENSWLHTSEDVPLLLPATVLAVDCYYQMFSGCTALREAPALPATTLAVDCYYQMFSGCTALREAPALPATVLAQGCYQGMFQGCTALTEAPALPATVLAEGCYSNMFSECTALREAPALPATVLAGYCYQGMFSYCTALTEAPALPATVLAVDCYANMFSGCAALESVICLAEQIKQGATLEWLGGVAPFGTFTKKAGVEWPAGVSGIPEGWTVAEA